MITVNGIPAFPKDVIKCSQLKQNRLHSCLVQCIHFLQRHIRITHFILVILIQCNPLFSNSPAENDSLGTHRIYRNKEGKFLAWYAPDIDGAGYGHLIKIASEFLKNDIPAEPETGLPLNYLFCEFEGPEYNDNFHKGTTGRWSLPHNPATVFAGFTESFAVKYRVYSGDDSFLDFTRKCLDHMLTHGTTTAGWTWSRCSYASSHPGNPHYIGTGYFGSGIGDGEYIIEPDKVGEMGIAYLQMYQITEEQVYLEAALACADALAVNIIPGDYTNSPWPYRVHARTGKAVEYYCSNILPPVKLFDMINSVSTQIHIDADKLEKYQKTRDVAWRWLFSAQGPMKTYVWKGYFEDTPIDNENRTLLWR